MFAILPDDEAEMAIDEKLSGHVRAALAATDGVREVKMFGGFVPIRAEVRNLDMLSAHADAGELVQWLRGFERPPGAVFLAHGEPAAADALRQRIAAALGWRVRVAEHGEVVTASARPYSREARAGAGGQSAGSISSRP